MRCTFPYLDISLADPVYETRCLDSVEKLIRKFLIRKLWLYI